MIFRVASGLLLLLESAHVADAFLSRQSTLAVAEYKEISQRMRNSPLASGSFLGMEDDEDDDDDEDEDDEKYGTSFSGIVKDLDPYDPNPYIKPRPSLTFEEKEVELKEADMVQTMTAEERVENLEIMRRIHIEELPDLQLRKDYAGWVELNNDFKRREAADPWFAVNERLEEAIQLDEDPAKIAKLQELARMAGGPPTNVDTKGIKKRGYANHMEIFDYELFNDTRIESLLEERIRKERKEQNRALIAERKANELEEERQIQESGLSAMARADKEARERSEVLLSRIMGEIEEEKEKKKERLKEMMGDLSEQLPTRAERMESIKRQALVDARRLRREQLGLDPLDEDIEKDDEDERDDDDDDDEDDDDEVAKAADATESSGGRPRLPGDRDVTMGELDIEVESSSSTVTGPLTVEVSSTYDAEQSDAPMRKHCFKYTIRIINNSNDRFQLLGRRFEIQTVGSSMKDVVQGEGVTGQTPILEAGQDFTYTSTAPLSVRPIGTTIIAARMRGEYRYVKLEEGKDKVTKEQLEAGGEETAELGTFHFIFPEEQRVKPFLSEDYDDDDEDDDDYVEAKPEAKPSAKRTPAPAATPAATIPGDADMKSGIISVPLNDSSELVTDNVRVKVKTEYKPERSDEMQGKHCFAYHITITNESDKPIQLVSRRFEIQTIGSDTKDIVQGPGVTGRQPTLKPTESFEYDSTAPLSVKPMLDRTPVVARMAGEYNFVVLGEDEKSPISSTPLQAKLGMFHFILPALT